VLIIIAHVLHIFSVLIEVKSFIAKRKEDDQKRLEKKAGRLRHFAREMWHKGDDESKLQQWRGKIEAAVKHFHVGTMSFQSIGNFIGHRL
jgi:hypothetical protein